MSDETSARSIAVLGSSGGNLRSHGGSDPARMLRDVVRQAEAAGFTVSEAQFVFSEVSMDQASPDSPAALWSLEGTTPVQVVTGTLAEVNAAARERDIQIANAVSSGQVDGLILMSADPEDTNERTIVAAAAADLPAAGTGGTSIAAAQCAGVKLVAASGTTGTTSTTRAVSYIAGLARYWGVTYHPVLGGPATTVPGSHPPERWWKRISIRGIMIGSIPAFISLAVVLALSKIPFLDGLEPVFDTLIDGLPIVVAAVAARRVSGLPEVGMIAGVVAGILATPGGLLGGLVAGILSGFIAAWLLPWALAHRFPATTANIVTGAIAGLVPGLIVYFALAPVTDAVGLGVKNGIAWAVDVSPVLAGALAGLAIWPAIIGGVYHSVILPLVLLEMGEKGFSFFGAIDMVSLVMVSLGITLANVIAPRTSGERALAGSGAAVNFFFGTFVESSYPFMFGDKKVFAIALASATAGGAVVGAVGAEATAYVPAVVAPFVSTTVPGMAVAMAVACVIAFVLTLLVALAHRRAARAQR